MAQTSLPRTQPAKIRAQAADPPNAATPAPFRMPSPSELGLGARDKIAEVDWSDVRRRLQGLGVTSFHLERLPDGAFRFSCAVPTSNGMQKVAAEAVGEADAINRALSEAERLK
jgi:hypothetical protein